VFCVFQVSHQHMQDLVDSIQPWTRFGTSGYEPYMFMTPHEHVFIIIWYVTGQVRTHFQQSSHYKNSKDLNPLPPFKFLIYSFPILSHRWDVLLYAFSPSSHSLPPFSLNRDPSMKSHEIASLPRLQYFAFYVRLHRWTYILPY